MPERSAVRWDEISRDAKFIVGIWTDGRETDWAKKSWEILAKSGLTSYSDEIERTRVKVRLMALGAIYRDFCELAFDEIHEPEHTIWADELDIGPFRVAQCMGPKFEHEEKADEKDLFETALAQLMDEGRAQIHSALRAEFGDDSLLFVSLWNTADFWRPEHLEAASVDGENQDLRMGREIDNMKQPAAEIDWLEDAAGFSTETSRGRSWLRTGGFRTVCKAFTEAPCINGKFDLSQDSSSHGPQAAGMNPVYMAEHVGMDRSFISDLENATN